MGWSDGVRKVVTEFWRQSGVQKNFLVTCVDGGVMNVRGERVEVASVSEELVVCGAAIFHKIVAL